MAITKEVLLRDWLETCRQDQNGDKSKGKKESKN
jgi:hypothetical protein